MEICPDCKAQVPPADSRLKHGYLGASSGCWKVYGEVLAKEYCDPEYMKFHRWTVDAYAAQHPGAPEPRTIQSINVHLLALYLLVEKASEPAFVISMMGRLIKSEKHRFAWLPPPKNLGSMTVVQAQSAKSAQEHGQLVRKWGEEVWHAWHEHHATIRSLAASVAS